ncbi:unnamed protein product [Polarella glacialis]|uniref:BTB domain-containing protein n=1 Tax=Polarella glacialis TaxID=89957 RepID=A0A813IZK0_POLGL|nr:unnamed protein product [Polarella glacialis]
MIAMDCDERDLKRPALGPPEARAQRTWESVDGRELGPVVQLNVGGQRHVAARSTLEQSPYFRRLLEMKVLMDASGAVFIDRDGDAFAGILDWLRTRELVSSHRPCDSELLQLRLLKREADFFGLDGLIVAVDEAIAAATATVPPTEQKILSTFLFLESGVQGTPLKLVTELQNGWRVQQLSATCESGGDGGLYCTFVLERPHADGER